MLFVVAGVPAELFGRFQQVITNTFGDGHLIVAKPLRARRDGKFYPDRDYGLELLRDLANRVEFDPTILRHGCAVIVLSSPSVDAGNCARCFEPFALTLALDLPIPTLTVGHAGSRTINALAKRIRESLVGLRKGVRAMNSEVSSRRNRTPLLLPMRNFSSDVLHNEIESLYFNLGRSDDPTERIRAACQRIEDRHPFTKPGGGSFYDKRGIRFKAPGRAIHGNRSFVGNGHQAACLLNSHLRLGGYAQSGFHYDCTEGENGKLIGQFSDCHGACDAHAGKPHLNIYSNDFIR